MTLSLPLPRLSRLTTRRLRRAGGRHKPVTASFARERGGQPARQIDVVLLGTVLLLAGFGLMMVYESSAAYAAANFGSRFFLLERQVFNFALGLAGLVVASRIPYAFWRRVAPLILGTGLVLMVAIMIPGLGETRNGATRWLDLGFTSLQPSYMVCFGLILYLASWLADPDERKRTILYGLLPYGLLLGFILGLVIVTQKDLGTGLIITGTSLAVYFLSGAPLRHFGVLFPSGLAALSAVIILEPFRMRRLMTFLNPGGDLAVTGYHINQTLLAVGSGGLLGTGLGQSRQKYGYVPEVYTDSIFAVIGEEFGFFGAAVLLAVYLFLLLRGFQLAMRVPDMFARLVVAGIMTLIGMQVFVNMFAMVGLVPLTGIPLPFISYGGTSLIVLLTGIGIVLNISRSVPPETKAGV